MLKNLLFIIGLVIAVTFQMLEAKAAPGDYDPSFGIGGIAERQLSGLKSMSDITLQRDGKILVAGYAEFGQTKRLVLRRHYGNGSLDTSFGAGGEAVEQIAPNDYRYILGNLSAIELQSDGSILVGGGRRAADGTSLGLAV